MARGLIDTFRKPDFNVAAFVRDAGHGDTSRLSQQLQDAALTLEEDLRREIANCHEELLLCASSINDLDGQLGEAHEIVGALKASVSKVRGEVLVPFQDIKWKVELLERMQEVNVLIRRVVRFLWDARKLRSQMDAPGKDFSKAAHTLHELEQLLQETGLDKVRIGKKGGQYNHHGAIPQRRFMRFVALQLKHFTEQRRVAGAEKLLKIVEIRGHSSLNQWRCVLVPGRLHIFTPDPFA